MLRQNRVEIDMDAIRNNYRILRDQVPADVEVMPVIKANAYGHGMLETADALSGMGASHFAVALPERGHRTAPGRGGGRGAGAGRGYAPRGGGTACATALRRRSLPRRWSRRWTGRLLPKVAKRWCISSWDTGMNRIGLRTEEEADALAAALASAPHVRATGIYTHFADADNPLPDGGMNPFTRAQLKRFCELRAHFNPDIPAHVANSAMSLRAPEAYFNMIREGIFALRLSARAHQFALHTRLELVYRDRACQARQRGGEHRVWLYLHSPA